jgi:CDP-paratose 2-epimerase
MHAFMEAPRPGEVYNLGGGRENSASILECIAKLEQMTGRTISATYQPANRVGDHICYISNLNRLRSHYPEWSVSISLDDIFDDMLRAEWNPQGAHSYDTRVDTTGAGRAEVNA